MPSNQGVIELREVLRTYLKNPQRLTEHPSSSSWPDRSQQKNPELLLLNAPGVNEFVGGDTGGCLMSSADPSILVYELHRRCAIPLLDQFSTSAVADGSTRSSLDPSATADGTDPIKARFGLLGQAVRM